MNTGVNVRVPSCKREAESIPSELPTDLSNSVEISSTARGISMLDGVMPLRRT